jgi:hypothetical protein
MVDYLKCNDEVLEEVKQGLSSLKSLTSAHEPIWAKQSEGSEAMWRLVCRRHRSRSLREQLIWLVACTECGTRLDALILGHTATKVRDNILYTDVEGVAQYLTAESTYKRVDTDTLRTMRDIDVIGILASSRCLRERFPTGTCSFVCERQRLKRYEKEHYLCL